MGELSISQAFADLKISEIESTIQKEIDQRGSHLEIIRECQKAMEKIGKKFEAGEYYLAELLMAAEMFKRATRMLSPLLSGRDPVFGKALGKIVLGSVKGDIHDLGKNIFGIMATAAGFQVLDLGVDVAPVKFVDAMNTEKPDIIGMSGLITTVFPMMKEVVDILKGEKLREKVKVIIGGGATGEETRRYVGADAQTIDAGEGVRICRNFVATPSFGKKEVDA